MLRHYYETENCAGNYNVYVTEIDYTVNPPKGIKYLAEQRLFNDKKWEMTDYNKDGSINKKSIVDFTDDIIVYSESKEGKYTRKYFNYENGLTAISIAEDINNNIFQIDEFWYDQKNNIIKERNWENGNDSVSFLFYDSKDVLLKCCTYENNDLVTETKYSRERDCLILYVYNKARQLLRITKYYSDENGLFNLMEEIDGAGKLKRTIKWERDDYKLIRKIQRDGAGQMLCDETYTYDKHNRDDIQRRVEYCDGKIYQLLVREYKYF